MNGNLEKNKMGNIKNHPFTQINDEPVPKPKHTIFFSILKLGQEAGMVVIYHFSFTRLQSWTE